jgi:gas vesicle protein GvpG
VILFKLLALPVTAPAAGIRYCLEKVLELAEQQMWDEDPVREQLILVNEAFEEGRMPEAEFREREAELLARLREIREHKKAAAQAQLSSMPDEDARAVVIELPDELR